jgi:hypothetical protein
LLATAPTLRDSLLKLAEEYAAPASAQEENDDRTVWQAGSDDEHD